MGDDLGTISEDDLDLDGLAALATMRTGDQTGDDLTDADFTLDASLFPPTPDVHACDAEGDTGPAPATREATAAYFGDYNPSAFGWTPNASIVPFTHDAISFPQGVASRVAPLFTGMLNELVAAGLHVPDGPVMAAGNWGYEYRDVRGSSTLSFHAFGTAIDIDALHNPMSYAAHPATTFPGTAHTIIRKWGCEWGYDWSGRKDPMHIECHLAPAQIDGWIKALKPDVSTKPTDTTVGHTTLKAGSTGTAVVWLQRRLNLQPSAHHGFDASTEKWVKRYQQFHLLTVDGIVGASTWNHLLNGPVIVGERRLFIGCVGPDVGWAQKRLGYTPAPRPAYGPKTQHSVFDLQTRHKVSPVTGIIEHPEWVLLGINPPK